MPMPAQKRTIRAIEPYIQICVLLETPKVGKGKGRILLLPDDAAGADVCSGEEVSMELVAVGLAFTGRSG